MKGGFPEPAFWLYININKKSRNAFYARGRFYLKVSPPF
jgi:hypothetical protein